MNALRSYYCPSCAGAGEHWRSPSGSANDPGLESWECSECDGSGRVDLRHDDERSWSLRPYTPSRRRWHGYRAPYKPESDPLIELARCRTTGARGRSVAYANAKRRAMYPIALPQDDEVRLVSPETAAYFNALNRRAAA